MTLRAPLPNQESAIPATGSGDSIRLTSSICDTVAQKSVGKFGASVRALVLTGSLARNEGTFSRAGHGKWVSLGDAEFVLVLNSGIPLPPEAEVASLIRAIEDALSDCGISCSVSMGVCHDDYLRALKPHIFAYELICRGRVVCGEDRILSLIPPFAVSAIPREDAWRMLSNRIVEQLKLVDELSAVPEKLSVGAHYQLVKFVLDMATSFLLFAGHYAPSYRERNARLALLAAQSAGGPWPFDLTEFSRLVETCTDWKLAPEASADAGFALWNSATCYARQLLTWELEQLTGGAGISSTEDLMARWMRRQSIGVRLRGWLYVLRREGWRRSHLVMGKLLRKVWVSSPRYAVYAAATLLFFQLPGLFLSGAAGVPVSFDETAEIIETLPMRRHRNTTSPVGWRDLAHEIVWNYNRYLVETRS